MLNLAGRFPFALWLCDLVGVAVLCLVAPLTAEIGVAGVPLRIDATKLRSWDAPWRAMSYCSLLP